MRLGLSLLFLFALAPLLPAQTISMPKSLDVKTGRLAPVVIKSDCKSLVYDLVADGPADVFREASDDGAVRLRVLPYADGKFYLYVSGAVGDKVTSAKCVITATGGAPTPTPVPPLPSNVLTDAERLEISDAINYLQSWASNPGATHTAAYAKTARAFQLYAKAGNIPIPAPTPLPVPPTPVPPTPVPPKPDPTPPAPIPMAGFRVLIVYDGDNYTAGQDGIITGKAVRDYLQSKCVAGDDGKTKAFAIIRSDANVTNAPKWIADTVQRHPGQKSYMVVSDGKTGYDGPLPADANAALAILRKVGG